MKKLLFNLFFLAGFILLAQNLQAQAPKMENAELFKSYLKTVYDAYEKGNGGDMFNYYTADATEIGPDGSLTSGIAALKASWATFEKMMDEKPKFTYQLTSSRMITPDVAIITWDSNSDIKIGGQQIGGKATAVAVVVKKGNRWMIEFDGLTPVIPMPDAAATGNK